MNFLRQLALGIAQAWRQLSVSARVNIVIAGLAVAGVIGYLVLTGAQPQYVTIREGLEPQEASKIGELLLSKNFQYTLSDKNSTVKVPVSQFDEAQLALVEAEAPAGRPKLEGWGRLDRTDMMSTKWLEDRRFMVAVQEELEKQLMAFDFVRAADVTITHAKEEFFSRDQKPSAASVVLDVTQSPSERQIKGIVQMVSRFGSPHLDAQHITVALSNGDFVYLPQDDRPAWVAGSRNEVRRDEEAVRERKIEAKLKEMGINGVVTVSAVMNFDQKTIEQRKAEEGVEISTYTKKDDFTTQDRVPEGAPGATTNVPEGTGQAQGGQSNKQNSKETISNIEPSFTNTKTSSDGGTVVQYVVTVAAEGKYESAPDPNDNTKTIEQYVALTPEQIGTIEAVAKAAVGEGETPTSVKVQDWQRPKVPKETVAQIEEMKAARSREWMLQLAWNIVQIVAIIMGFFLIRMFLLRVIERPGEEEEEEDKTPLELTEATREDVRRERVAEQVIQLAESEPDLMAQLLRTWLSEEED